MKGLLKRLIPLALLCVLVVSLLPRASAQGGGDAVTLLFTHDTHSHFLSTDDGDGGLSGGYVRLAAALTEQRALAAGEGRTTFTLDAGDFSMGTLFQCIFATHAAELRALGAMGYDATTLGNHEFDYRPIGLAQMLEAAMDSGDPLPRMVVANYRVDFDGTDTENKTALSDALERYPVTEYTVIERDGVRLGVFGITGYNSHEYAPMSGMALEDPAQAAQRVVDALQANEDVDYIVCLSHSGTDDGKGEDYDLAKAVDGIDVIVSGHTHTTLHQPIQVNDTLIVSCGPYTKNLGVVKLSKDSGGKVVLDDYRLLPIDETIEEDAAMAELTAAFKDAVSEYYLDAYDMTFDQVLTTSSFSFTPFSQFGNVQEEDSLGNLIADSYIYAVKEAEGENYIPIDFAVVPSGVIRDSFTAGDITVADAFNVSSLGSGGDGTPGYPLISVYITGAELKDAFEVDASVTPIMPEAQLYGAGMTWTYNPNRMIFNKVTSCAQVLEDGTTLPLEDDKLYRVVTGLYTGQMLESVNGKSFGILAISPKDEAGNPVTDWESRIIHTADGSEVKEWYALASYLASMDTVPLTYSGPEGRKVSAPSWNPIRLLENPKPLTLIVLGIVALLLAAVVLIVRAVIRRRRRKKGYRR